MSRPEKKLSFLLTDEQRGPFPINTESFWCLPESNGYRVKNIPMFVDQVSFDDLISVTQLADGNVALDEVLEKSGNSTLWVYLKDPKLGAKTIEELSSLGCGMESGVIKHYYGINVPAAVSIKPVLASIERAKSAGIAIVDYPSVRHSI